MARKLAAGNWKMNGLAADLAEIDRLGAMLPDSGCDVLICPPATLVARMAERAGARILVGGQDCHAASSGAHTGDISAAMLRDAGASHVILGHSERRADHAETDAAVRSKALAAQAEGLVAIVCVGETEAQRDAGRAVEVIASQLEGALPDDPALLVIAYEPVWAIGTGRTPTEAEVAQVHSMMRATLARRFGAAADGVPLLYGGSVKPANAAQIFAIADVDGALVGGASLKADEFGAIVSALAAAAKG
ncbi:triose-phosphate isomerase [Plastorhodobacter daqingensis]|uniref:Triosephosphate isomerase n=1 Tax=Plastorhodobacter daqingensis TaxID=1387281 RepID=A0ABW2UI03_9RHOB